MFKYFFIFFYVFMLLGMGAGIVIGYWLTPKFVGVEGWIYDLPAGCCLDPRAEIVVWKIQIF